MTDTDDGEPGRAAEPAIERSTTAGPGRAPAGLVRAGLTAVVLNLLATLTVATAFVGAGPALADLTVQAEAVQLRSPWLTVLMTAITDAGRTATMGLLAALVGLWLIQRSRIADAIFVVGTMVGAATLFTGLKRLLDRPRPPEIDRAVEASNESLPSGHATMAVAVIGSLVVLAWSGRSTAARVGLVAAATCWAGAVGLTRVYLGVHWFSDVLAGWLVGGAWLALCVAAWTWFRRRTPPPS